jgi:hypothetical protein
MAGSMSIEKVKAIIVEAKSGGFYDGDLDQPDSDLLRDANGLIRQAKRAASLGNKSETIAKIVHMAESDDVPATSNGNGASAEKESKPQDEPASEAPADEPITLYSPDGSEVEAPTKAAAAAMLAAGFTKDAPGVVEAPSAVSDEQDGDVTHEELEDEITGKMLKAYGKGRASLPDLEISDLHHMIANPDGPKGTLPSEVRAAKEAEAKAEQERLLAEEAAKQTEEKPEPKSRAKKSAKEAIKESSVGRLDRERLPIPAEIPDENIPEMPFDMTKVPEQELISLHSRFHACEARANFLISELGDEAADYGKLANDQELKVRNALDRDEFKLKDDIDAAVQMDAKVKEYRKKEHEAKKELGRAKMLAGNYHRDCERLRWSYFMLKGENPSNSDAMRR